MNTSPLIIIAVGVAGEVSMNVWEVSVSMSITLTVLEHATKIRFVLWT